MNRIATVAMNIFVQVLFQTQAFNSIGSISQSRTAFTYYKISVIAEVDKCEQYGAFMGWKVCQDLT